MQGRDFKVMGFLTYTVETYEKKIPQGEKAMDDSNEDRPGPQTYLKSRSLDNHLKSETHHHILWSEYHNYLPNIVGRWFPHQGGEEATNGFYYASMLALLKPWRDLHQLKLETEDWRTAFMNFIGNASQRDKDVVAGSQYYYESKNAAVNRDIDDKRNSDVGAEGDVEVDVQEEVENEGATSEVSIVECLQKREEINNVNCFLSVIVMSKILNEHRGKTKNIFMVNWQ